MLDLIYAVFPILLIMFGIILFIEFFEYCFVRDEKKKYFFAENFFRIWNKKYPVKKPEEKTELKK